MTRFSHLAISLLLVAPLATAQKVPSVLIGTWRIQRTLPTRNIGCWNGKQSQQVLHTTLTYTRNSLRWHNMTVPIFETFTRTVTDKQFHRDTVMTYQKAADLSELGIHAASVTEFDLQHDDVDITEVTTEAPGDTVLLLAPGRMVFSVCGTYFEATRVAVASIRKSTVATHPSSHAGARHGRESL